MSTAPRGADETEFPVSSADAGPPGGRDNSIALKAVALDEGGSFIHLTYPYAYGVHGTKLLADSSHT